MSLSAGGPAGAEGFAGGLAAAAFFRGTGAGAAAGAGAGAGVGAGVGAGAGAEAGAGTADFSPFERSMAERVISLDPQPGHVRTPSGFASGPMVVLQRGQFIAPPTASITYTCGPL